MDHGFRERDGGEEMILKEVRCIHWDMEKETKQKDDKVEQVVNGRVDPWLKLRLGGGAKELQGMSLQLYQLPSMKNEAWVEEESSQHYFLFIFLSLCNL